MMIPEVGSMPKVSGSSSATPDGGPTPGSAPIRMPMTTPQTAMNRLNGVSATEKPSARFEAKSIAAAPSEPERPGRHRHPQPVGEDVEVQAGVRHRHREAERPGLAIDEAEQDEQEQQGGDDHAEDVEQQHQCRRGSEDENQPAQALATGKPGLAWLGGAQGADQQRRR